MFSCFRVAPGWPPRGGQTPSLRARSRTAKRFRRHPYIGPDVAPAVEPAEFRVPGADEGRQLDPLGDLGAPALDHAGNAARLQRVGADLVKVAELARLELRRERCRQEILLSCSVTNSRMLGGQPSSFCDSVRMRVR